MRGRRRTARLLAPCLTFLWLFVATACSTGGDEPVTLRVLASSELEDMRPLLDELRRDTGITLEMDYRGTDDATRALGAGHYEHDLAWLSSDRPLQLKLKAAGVRTESPISTSIMRSPVVIGLKPAAAGRLRGRTPDGQISWADVADAAADGSLSFGMADPGHTDSGLAALVGVATAAAGTGAALRPEDVSCERLNGFFTGHLLTEDSSAALADGFVKRQGELDALVTYESELLALNAGGRLREPLEIVHPKDGMVLADYPLLLLDPAKRAAYDRLVDWLKSGRVQKKIMERTLRRPVDPAMTRIASLRPAIGNALYFPDRQEVLDRLLSDYGDAKNAPPARVFFVLDFSTSMKGERIAGLRATFAGLGGEDGSPSGKFLRFHRGESFTLIRFAGRVLDERTITYRTQADLDLLRAAVASDDFGEATAVWSALDRAYGQVGQLVRAFPGQGASVVLMTDGENNAGIGLDAFLERYRALPPAAQAVHTYTVRYGDADPQELDRAARATGGRMVDATAQSLLSAFKETRGCTE
ncbi:VWA domain-containing protein [Streptomyces sp. NBC_00335]|uniref:vWA domain-containing protein n=1 Tax=unclassified Streptomyces TaxID=2593676 RepID=UPI002259D5DE|nr:MULTISPECIES: VWA domain-containing protein [unclassified Streptomyces]MCX5403047.1 VWA domain-containing protein [Streptomyces sp. NBC_00086]